MSTRAAKQFLAVFAGAVAAYGVLYAETLLSLVRKWSDSTTYNHGFVILPICLWLAWRKRHALANVASQPSLLACGLLLIWTAAWLVARGTGVLVLEQIAAVLILIALVPAIFGWQVARLLVFPLAFLFFAVPFGRGAVPLLMEITADVATLGLRWSGVPVLRTHMYISVPGGDFEVARACAGLSYLISGLMLGVLYAYVNFDGWRKRLLCIAAFAVIPVLANGIRVYLTILVSYLTDMRYGPGQEHVTFGRIFFLVTVFAMFWLGRRWHDHHENPDGPGGERADTVTSSQASGRLAVAAIAIVCLLPAPLAWSAAVDRMSAMGKNAQRALTLPAGPGWQGPLRDTPSWRPEYRGGLAELQGAYRSGDDPPVEVFVAAYGLGVTAGQEMIAYSNVLMPSDLDSLAEERERQVTIPGGKNLAVRELQLDADGRRLQVWYWFMVGQRTVTSPFEVKAYEALSFTLQRPDLERIVTLATIADSRSTQRLESFLAGHAECLLRDVATPACAGR